MVMGTINKTQPRKILSSLCLVDGKTVEPIRLFTQFFTDRERGVLLLLLWETFWCANIGIVGHKR
jgi:hypothetical protein